MFKGYEAASLDLSATKGGGVGETNITMERPTLRRRRLEKLRHRARSVRSSGNGLSPFYRRGFTSWEYLTIVKGHAR